MLSTLTGCSLITNPYSNTKPQAVKIGEFDIMRYHILRNSLIIEFQYDLHIPSMSFIGATTEFKTNQTVRTIEITILDKLSGPQVTEAIENGNEIFIVDFPNFDRQKDRVLYKDDEGVYEIPFASIRNNPFEPYRPSPIDMNNLFN